MTTDAVTVAKRLVQRGAWELYSARVLARRWLLDRVCSPRRRQRLLRESVSFEDGPDRCFTIAAPVGIEPRFGYLVRGRSTIIEDALMGSECVRQRALHHAFSGVPSLRQLAADERRKQVLTGPLITLRHTFESIYYDVVIDCIGALALLDELDELADVPIVIGATLRDSSVMTSIVDAGVVDEDRLIVQGDRWLASDVSISFVLHDPLSERSLRRTAAYVARAVSSPSLSSSRTKLYVARGARGVGPHLLNESELVTELERRGFEAIDPGLMSWTDQYHRFRAATHVVGVHGTALTNVLFRAPDHMCVLELTPPQHDEDAFQTMSAELGYSFSRLTGADPSPGGTGPGFVVDIELLLKTVDAWDDSAV